eukprot:12412103-Karenia_brevis.AAC.1
MEEARFQQLERALQQQMQQTALLQQTIQQQQTTITGLAAVGPSQSQLRVDVLRRSMVRIVRRGTG